jgi:MFS family permease
MSTAATARNSRPFYGWAVVTGTFFVVLIGFGIAYSFAAFFDSLKRDFDASRGDVSLVFAITGFLYFSLGAVSGPIADRIGPRRVVIFGIFLMVVGLALASRAQALWQVYLTYSLGVGLGVGFAYVPAIGAVQRWFVRKRGAASGFAVTGIGVGTLAMPLLATGLIDLQGWRDAYLSLAAITVVVGVPAALLIEHSPARRNLHADGDSLSLAASKLAIGGLDVRRALRTRPFVLLYSAAVLSGLGLFIPFAHLVPYAKDHGLSETQGAVLIGLIGIGSTVGRLAMGPSADRFGRRSSLAYSFAAMAASLAFWLIATNLWTLAIFALWFGAAYGGYVALVPALATDYFGGRNAGGILGILFTGAGFGALLGPTLAGVAYDVSDSYTLPIAFGAATNIGALICILLLAAPDAWRAIHIPEPA